MTSTEAVAALDRIAAAMSSDPEAAHSSADAVLLAHVAPEVAEAYQRVADARSWWSCA